MAAGLASLTAEQRDIGTALVNIGASITSIGLFAGGALTGIGTLGSGGNDITDDIASEFGTRRSQAERLKCFYGSALSSPRDHQDLLDIGGSEQDESERPKITRAQLNAVIRKRLDHFVPQIGRILTELGDGGPTQRQVVLTGGAAELKGMADYVQNALGGSVRVAAPQGVVGLPPAHAGPAFSTAVGLVVYASAPPRDIRPRGSEQAANDADLRWWERLMALWERQKS
ncbi:MAG: rod shape-determining protein [Sphingopyxis sp.]|nr:rod shape-determining protein [Sphingopyxis sp.]